jgi:hypothetical protein
MLIRTAKGVGIVSRNLSGGLDLIKSYRFNDPLGWWRVGSGDLFGAPNGVGNCVSEGNAPRRDEFTVRSAWGFGILRMDDNKNLSAQTGVAWGQSMGGWTFRSADRLIASADFNRDASDDLMFVGQDGIGIFRGSDLTPIEVKLYGQSIGWWRFGTDNTILAAGDFDEDGWADFVIRSGWGMAVISRQSGALAPVFGYAFPATIPAAPNSGVEAMTLDTSATVIAAGDFDGDGYTDLLVNTGAYPGKVAVIGHRNGIADALVVLDQYPAGSLTLNGAWCANGKGQCPVGLEPFDYNGDGRSDILSLAREVNVQ